MRRSPALLGAVVLIAIFSAASVRFPLGSAKPAGSSTGGAWRVYFSPRGGATAAIVKAIGGARRTVLAQAYSFTSAPIAKALLNAHKRGVKVQVILDDSQLTQKYSSAVFFRNSGIPTRIDSAHAIAHNKVMVIDGVTVITGSFNFTRAAEERNAENVLIVRDKALAERYTSNWRAHERHSRVYGRRGG
ncbi:MAG: phospholipase D family protein [Armatimonadota bacterium]|nr:phospholipase D family protein [Armatimonadota bacterium]